MSRKKNFEKNDNENIIENTDKYIDNPCETIETVQIAGRMTYKVIKSISDNKAIIDFDGFGLIVDCSPDNKFVDIKYSGKIGKADFKYEVV